MKKIWGFLKHHIGEDYNRKHYLAIGVLLIVCISLNYTWDFEDSYLDDLKGIRKFFSYFIFYSIPYLLVVWLYCLFQNKSGIFTKGDFWIRSLFGLAILSLDASVPFLQPIIEQNLDYKIQFWSFKVAVNMISFFTVFLPILLFYFFIEHDKRDIYGLAPRRFDSRPYFLMLLIMLPLMIAASFTDGFLRQYPMYKITNAHEYLGVGEWVTVVIYEMAYGLDFITVEYLFRGFFVIAMISVLGRGAVLSMAVLYCVLHFGKPMGEAISSIFGGYILGVVAYETRSIWGGIIVHMGIAWLMELIAFLAKL